MASTSSKDADSANRRPASGAVTAGGGGGGGRRRGGLAWLLGLLAVVALVGLAVALLAGGDGDERSGQVQRGTDGDEGGEAGSAAGTEAGDLGGNAEGGGAAGGAGAGTLVASGNDLLPAPAGGLAGSVGDSAQGTGVTVQSVVEDGFWVGSSESDRVYVEWGGTVGEDESDTYLPKEGDRVDLTGPVRPAPEDPARTLRLGSADAELVSAQAAYVNADTVTPAQ